MDEAITITRPIPTKSQDEDLSLIQRYLAGDQLAFDELMIRHERQVYGLCHRFATNQDDALDLSQEVFMKVFQRLPSFRREAQFKTWLYRVAVNHCLNHVKKTRPIFVPINESTRKVEPSIQGEILEKERHEIVRKLVHKLPPRQKVILELKMNQQLTYNEIADILNRSVSTIKSSVFFAIRKLNKMVKEEGLVDRLSKG